MQPLNRSFIFYMHKCQIVPERASSTAAEDWTEDRGEGDFLRTATTYSIWPGHAPAPLSDCGVDPSPGVGGSAGPERRVSGKAGAPLMPNIVLSVIVLEAYFNARPSAARKLPKK
ncbi:hypothetical protein NDU88_005080 [Pleurodeles waltl]|uniref:Uncharacterized protein n=1 Tax=Pleurodeles waltl TaxID=8319 RepID=A0AAV7V6Y7_PLEWA|nr:hypothetical protein NDU88_005080 [Pleurodeles waltl]